MKCDKHPDMDAVGTCVYCGRGVCDDCKVRVYDKIHCKECVEAGRVRGNQPPPQVYQPVPVYYFAGPPMILLPPHPKGPPAPLPLRLGSIGAVISGIALFVMGGSFYLSPTLLSATTTLFCLGLMVLAIGCFGTYWNFGCFWGGFGAVSLPIMGSLILILTFLMGGALQVLSGGFFFLFIPLLVISMVFVHLSLSHMRTHLPRGSSAYNLMNINRILNYIAGAGVAAFMLLSILLFFLAGGILIIDFLFLMSVPLPEPPQQQQQPQPYYPQSYYPPRY